MYTLYDVIFLLLLLLSSLLLLLLLVVVVVVVGIVLSKYVNNNIIWPTEMHICGVMYIFPYTSEAMFLHCVFCGMVAESLL